LGVSARNNGVVLHYVTFYNYVSVNIKLIDVNIITYRPTCYYYKFIIRLCRALVLNCDLSYDHQTANQTRLQITQHQCYSKWILVTTKPVT